MTLTIAVFLLVYLAMGLGQLPGFKVDRTGAAIVGALVLMAAGRIAPQAAWDAIDYRTVGLLFGLMVVSAAFVVSGFYGWAAAARRHASPVAPPVLLAILVAVAGLLSAVLTNDVVVVAMTPLLVTITLSRGLNPVPFLLAFCFAANTGSAGTIIGSPQNMIAAQGLGISFNGFLRIAAVPASLSLPIVWGVVALLYRGRWHAGAAGRRAPVPAADRPLGDREGGARHPRRRRGLRAHRLAERARRARRRGDPARQPHDRLVRHARQGRRQPAAAADGPVHRQRGDGGDRPAAATARPIFASAGARPRTSR